MPIKVIVSVDVFELIFRQISLILIIYGVWSEIMQYITTRNDIRSLVSKFTILLFFFLNLLLVNKPLAIEIVNPQGAYPLHQFSMLTENSTINISLLNEEGLIAYQNYTSENFLQAKSYINQSIAMFNPDESPLEYINTLILRSFIAYRVGDSINALQDLHKAYPISSKYEFEQVNAEILLNIGGLHQGRNEHNIALEYLNKALLKFEQQENQERSFLTQLLRMTSLLANKRTLDAATLLMEIKPYFMKTQYQGLASYYLQFKGEVESLQGKAESSIESYETALQVSSSNNLMQIASLHLLLSKSYASLKNMSLAIDHMVKAFSVASKARPSFYFYQTLQLHRANLLEQLEEFEAAYRVTQNLIEDNASKPIEDLQTMLNMHANFQLNIQKQENQLLKENNRMQAVQLENKKTLNQFYFVLVGLLFSISILLLLLFLRSRKHQKALEQITHTDGLTQLYSRSRVLELLTHHKELFDRNHLRFCVAIIDLDYFKKINDTHGHVTGDKVLKKFGEICKNTLRKTDIVGRIGGEEFLLILPDTTINNAKDVCNMLNRKLPDIGLELELSIKTTASIGLVSPSKNEETMDIVKRADKCLYEAKESGRNNIVLENGTSNFASNVTRII